MANSANSISSLFTQYEATLANGSEINSDWVDCSTVDKFVFTGDASASGMTATIDSKATESGVVTTTTVTYTDSTLYQVSLACRQRYMRFKWTNNTGSQVTDASLEIKLTFGSSDKGTTIPLNHTISDTTQSVVNQTVLKARDVNGDYTNVSVSTSGELSTTNIPYNVRVGNGDVSNATVWNKFGYNLDVDSGGEELIASFGGTINIMTSGDTLDVVSSSAEDGAGTSTGVLSVLITGISDTNTAQTEIVTMNGTTPVTTSNSWLGINRVVALSVGSNGSAVGTITIDDTSNAVGVQAEIPIGANVTQQCVFHTPITNNLLTEWLIINARKLSGAGGSPRVTIKGYSYSRVTSVTYEVFRLDIDTSVENTVQLTPPVPFVIGGREVLYFTAETNTNNTTVNCRFSGILIDNT